jgi:hypothetical protein
MTTSNRELIETANHLAKELGKEPPKTDGLKNPELSKLVEDLTAEIAAKKADGASGLPTGDVSKQGESSSEGPKAGAVRSSASEQLAAKTAEVPPGSPGNPATATLDPVREDGTVAHTGEADPMRVGGGEPAKPLEGEVRTFTNDPSISERNGTAPTPRDRDDRSIEELPPVDLSNPSQLRDGAALPSGVRREETEQPLGQAGTLGTPGSAREKTYKVAQGHSVTTLRGIIGEDQEVSARDFAGGAENLRTLVESKVVEESDDA